MIAKESPVVERSPKSLIAEWLKAHDTKYRVFERDYLEGRLAICREIDSQDKYWKGIGSEFSSHHTVREPNLHAYSELMHHIFSEYMPEVSSGVEFGCGPQNSFYLMLPERVKRDWKMIDIQPVSVWLAKDRNPSGRYCAGSFSHPPIKEESQELVAGFNSFETTLHLEHAMGQLHSILRKGGYLLAVQDVMPSEFSTIIREYIRNGGKPVETLADKEDGEIPILIKTGNGIYDVRSYHMVDMKEIGERLGMTPLFCGVLESSSLTRRDRRHTIPRLDMETFKFEEDDSKNTFLDLVARFSADTGTSLPEGYVSERIAANVLVLKK